MMENLGPSSVSRRLRGNQKQAKKRLDVSESPIGDLPSLDEGNIAEGILFADFMGQILGLLVGISLPHTTYRGEMATAGLGSSFRAMISPRHQWDSPANGDNDFIVKFPENSQDPERCENSFSAIICELRVLTHDPVRYHPNIVKLKHLAWQDAHYPREHYSPGLALEHAQIGNLMDFQQPESFNLRFRTKLKICLDVALGLDFLHRCGIVHGDIKPSNILLFSEDTLSATPRAKLSDFSHALFEVDSDDQTLCWRGFTYEWAAPEVLNTSTQSVGLVHKSDIFSFGLLFWHVMLENPDGLPYRKSQYDFAGSDVVDIAISTIRANIKDLNIELVEKVLRLTLTIRPEERVNSVMELVKLLSDELSRESDEDIAIQVVSMSASFASKAVKPKLGELEKCSVFDVNEASIALSIFPKGVQRQIRNGFIAKLHTGLPRDLFAENVLQLSVCNFNGFGQEVNDLMGIRLLAMAAIFRSYRACAVLNRFCWAYGFEPPEPQVVPSVGFQFSSSNCLLLGAHSLSLIALADSYGSDLERQAIANFNDSQNRQVGIESTAFPSNYPIENSSRLKPQIEEALGLDGSVALIRTTDRGHTLLHLAAAESKPATVKILLDLGVPVDVENLNGETPLLFAIRNANLEVVLLLLSHGADTTHQTSTGCTPLHYISSLREEELRQFVIVLRSSQARVSVDIDCSEYEAVSWHYYVALSLGTPLHWAINRQNLEAARHLLDLGANPLFRNVRQCAPLTYIMMGCFTPFLELFTEERCTWSDAVRKELSANSGEYSMLIMHDSPFHYVLSHGSRSNTARHDTMDLFQSIVDPHLEFNIAGQLLWNAVNFGRLETALRLLETYPDIVDFVEETQLDTPLARAIQHGNRPMFELLMRYEPNLEISFSPGSVSYLHKVCGLAILEEDMLYFITRLVETGSNVNSTDEHQMSSLWHALILDQIAVARILLASGSTLAGENVEGFSVFGSILRSGMPSTNAVSFVMDQSQQSAHYLFIVHRESGRSALHVLASRGRLFESPRLKTIQMGIVLNLYNNSEFLDHQDDEGNTALHLAARAGNTTMARLLLEAGAENNQPNSQGQTPLAIALFRPHSMERETLCLNFEGKGAGRAVLRAFDGDTADVVALLKSNVKVQAVKDIDLLEEQLAELRLSQILAEAK